MTTDNTQELDELLDRLMQYSYDYGSGNIPMSENPPLIIARQTKQAILDWYNKQVEEAMAKFHLKKGIKYDVKASGSVIVITHTNKLKESDKEANEQL